MLRSDLSGVYLSVISHKRPANVKPMTNLIGEATWYIGEGDYDTPYQKISGGLCESRNQALEDAFSHDAPCVQLSDDLKVVKMAQNQNLSKECTVAHAILIMLARLRESRFFKLAGVAPTDNAFYYNPRKPIHYSAFAVGDMILVNPTHLRFDENMKLKEDYDYTLQHIDTYGGIVRCNDILASFAHRSNPGGAVASRTTQLEKQSITYLKEKWGERIQNNPRRENEVLLRPTKTIGII